jgi:hypothetical protein
MSEPEADDILVDLSSITAPHLGPRHTIMDPFATVPLEVRHMIYEHLFPEVATHSPYNIIIFRDREWWRSGISPRERQGLPEYIVTGDPRNNHSLEWRKVFNDVSLPFRPDPRNDHRIAWLQPLKSVSLSSRLLRVDVAQWLYPKLAFTFDHSSDALTIFAASSQVVRESVRSISFQRTTTGCRGCCFCRLSRQWWTAKEATQMAALLPGLDMLELSMPFNRAGRPHRIKDLRVVQAILDNHPSLSKATCHSLDSLESDVVHVVRDKVRLAHAVTGKVRLVSESVFTETVRSALDVDGILSRYDAGVLERKRAKEEEREKWRKQREESRKK